MHKQEKKVFYQTSNIYSTLNKHKQKALGWFATD